jgi:hypothetical protein
MPLAHWDVLLARVSASVVPVTRRLLAGPRDKLSEPHPTAHLDEDIELSADPGAEPASESDDGFMSSADKIILNRLATALTIASDAVNALRFIAGVVAPTISQADDTTNSATADALKVQAQNATGTGATGGALDLRSGTGAAAAGGMTLRLGATIAFELMASAIEMSLATLRFGANVAGPAIIQADESGNSVTADTLLIRAQNAVGSTSTGGALDLRSGAGTTAAGSVTISVGSTVRFEVNPTGLGFFGVTPVARPGAYTQTYSTTSRTHAAYARDNESAAYTGIDNLQVGNVYAAVADLNALRVAYENLQAGYESTSKVLNQILDDLQGNGLLQ